MYNVLDLNKMTLEELHVIAQKFSVDNPTSLSKQDLIFSIIEKQGNSGIIEEPETAVKKETKSRPGRPRKVKEVAALAETEKPISAEQDLFQESTVLNEVEPIAPVFYEVAEPVAVFNELITKSEISVTSVDEAD